MLWFEKATNYVRGSVVLLLLDWLRWMNVPIFISNKSITNGNKIEGFSLVGVLSDWVSLRFPRENVLVLTDIDRSSKGRQYWDSMPKEIAIQFLCDVVVLHCKDHVEMLTLMSNTHVSFAEATAFSGGLLVGSNTDRETV